MVWMAHGNRTGLTFEVGESGTFSCRGKALHDAGSLWGDADVTALHRLHRCILAWALIAKSDDKPTIDSAGIGLSQLVQCFPARISGTIQRVMAVNPETIIATAVAPEAMFLEIRKMLELVLLSESLHYEFRLVPQASPANSENAHGVTLQEFLDGQPLFFTAMSFHISSNGR